MSADQLLLRLEEYKRRFSAADAARLAGLLRSIERRRFSTAASLIRLHETLLFLRAYPASAEILRLVESILKRFSGRVAAIDDKAPLAAPEVSGIAGSELTAVFSRDVARHLVRRHREQVSLEWGAWESPQRLGLILPDLLPLAADDMAVEAHVPYEEWLEAAGGLKWLVEKAGRFDELEVPLSWDLGDSAATRTHMRLPVRRIFYHREPLIPRRAVSLGSLPHDPPLATRKLSPRQGQRMIDLARDTSAVRYRELHGFTYGDERHVYEVEAGRGVVFYVWGVPPERRLPLRSYHAASIWKNGVPVGYFEALSLAERMEAGFNLYYTFREGETAWLYARLLKMFHDMLGVRCIWLDPYQTGHENEEAIASGAFWFYRKLGFRSVDAGLRELTAREEARIAADPARRTSPAMLRKLVRKPMVYEFPGAEPGAWDLFETRRIGLRAARALRTRFGGDAARMADSGRRAAGIAERDCTPHWAALLAILPGLAGWSSQEKQALRQALRAKAAPEEVTHLRMVQNHARLRRALLRL